MMMLRQRRAILAAVIGLTPVIIPLIVVFGSMEAYAPGGNKIFVHLVEYVHLKALVPLLALFFGCMLIGEDVESPDHPVSVNAPHPAVRVDIRQVFCLYGHDHLHPRALRASHIRRLHVPGQLLLLQSQPHPHAPLRRRYHYGLTRLRSPVRLSRRMRQAPHCARADLHLRLATGYHLKIPGVIEYLAGEIYMNALMPMLATSRDTASTQNALLNLSKTELPLSPTMAIVSLVLIATGFLVLTTLVVRHREYSAARALGV